MALRSFLSNGLLALVSVVVTLGLAEVAVRLLVDTDRQQPLSIHDVDHGNRKLSFLPGRSRRYETSEFAFTASYNRFGRRDVEWSDETVAEPSSVLFLGDSFVFGVGVEAEGTVPSLLEARAARDGSPVEVMNFGMPGQGAPPGYAMLLQDAIARGFAAGSVVAGVFVGNDFYPSVLTALEPSATETAPPVPPPPGGPSAWLPRSELIDFLRNRTSQSARMVGLALTLGRWFGVSVYDGAGTYVFLRVRTPEQEALFQRILGYLGEMQALCEGSGRRFLVVVFPSRIQVENGEDLTGAVYDAERPGRDVLEYCGRRGIACLDLLPVLAGEFRRTGTPLYYPIDRHLNAAGYQLASDAIYAFLSEHGVFGRSPAARP